MGLYETSQKEKGWNDIKQNVSSLHCNSFCHLQRVELFTFRSAYYFFYKYVTVLWPSAPFERAGFLPWDFFVILMPCLWSTSGVEIYFSALVISIYLARFLLYFNLFTVFLIAWSNTTDAALPRLVPHVTCRVFVNYCTHRYTFSWNK